MARYHYSAMADLTHQLTLSPVRLRLRQLDAIEHLVDLIDAEKAYPYDFVCHHITRYRPRNARPQRPMVGKRLIEDLVVMVEDLSNKPVLPAGVVRPCWTTEELAARLKVSTKTICRWRRRGLPGRRLRFPDGTVRMAFLERGIRRFVVKHHALVKRGAAFKQLSAEEKKRIVRRARELLAERRIKLHELSQIISGEVGRAVETVRYTLRQYDQSHPDTALFGRDNQPAVNPELMKIYRAVQRGDTPGKVGRQYGRSAGAVREVVREVRARILKRNEIELIYNEEFEAPDADERILANPERDLPSGRTVQPPRDLPPYLQDLYRQPLLQPEQERNLFRRYNYLKFKAERLRRGVDPLAVSYKQLDEIDALLRRAEEVKNQLLKANLRLVVSIARRHVGRSPAFFEIVSDGNMSLMRAVEKFDYARGFKFSTYASWAIMRNYARTIPEQMYPGVRLVTGSDELLDTVPAEDRTEHESVVDSARQLIRRGLGLLTARERDVVVRHYGLEDNHEAMTLDQIGQVFGVTKERVRQIERKAFAKLREALGDARADYVEA